MALSADMVWARKGVVLNPHYTNMNLFGSEYHTYFLQNRVGMDHARQITKEAEPLLAEDAKTMGLVDSVFGANQMEFQSMVEENATRMVTQTSLINHLVIRKHHERNKDWYFKLYKHRQHELNQMKKNFKDEAYHSARRDFVYH